MALEFRVRDFFWPRKRILEESEIRSGAQVLDYGCGPGSYVTALAEMVGKTGKVYALDAHPLAIKAIKEIISKRRLSNVETILSESSTGLSEDSLDVVLLFDILHDLADPRHVLSEIHRTLKPDGLLSVRDHHLGEAVIVLKITHDGLFRNSSKGKSTQSFVKR